MLKLSFVSGGIHRFTPGGVGGCRTMVKISSSLVICSLRLSGCAIAQWVVIPHLEGDFLAVERDHAGKHDQGCEADEERRPSCHQTLAGGIRLLRYRYSRPPAAVALISSPSCPFPKRKEVDQCSCENSSSDP